MLRSWRVFTILLIVVLGLGAAVLYNQFATETRFSGGLLPRHDLSSLATEYPLVVSGQVIGQETGKERTLPMGSTVEYRELDLEVTAYLRGSGADRITLSVPERASDSFVVGESYVVFLDDDEALHNAWGGYFVSDHQRVWQIDGQRLQPRVSHLDPMSIAEMREFLSSLP